MGRGNWRPNLDDYAMVYVEIDVEDEFEMLKEDLWEIMPRSMVDVFRPNSREGVVLCGNGHCELVLADNENSVAVAFVPHDDGYEGFHMRWIDQVSQNVFKRLNDRGWRLRVRCGPWTSGQWAA
jgi:hypothetical protein